MGNEILVYALGLCSCSVCAPITTDTSAIVREANRQHPTGIGPWAVSGNETFLNGKTNPCPCNEEPATKQHWLLEC